MSTDARKRILFVDDEPLVLDGLRRMLRPRRDVWDMQFVESGERALEVLAGQQFDVLVSDMRMPGMTGAELVNEVMRRHPQTARLVLSGHADQQMIMGMVNAAHQFLTKPCEPELLCTTIERACRVAARAREEQVARIASQLDRLPSMPRLYDELITRMRDPEAAIEDVARIVERDPAMSAKVLKLVNSAFFGLRRHVSDLVEAVNYLGLDTLRALVLSVHAFSQYEGRAAGPIALERLWSHCLRTATHARAIAVAEHAVGELAGEAFTGGMLHDVGWLLLHDHFPDRCAELVARVRAGAPATLELERSVLGMDHTEAGATLLALWGLPDGIVETVAWHHEPARSGLTGFRPLTCVHVAAHSPGFSVVETVAPAYTLDTVYLERNGFTACVSDWLAAATNAETSPP